MFQVRMEGGGAVFPWTKKLAEHSAGITEEVSGNNVVRIVDESEWSEWGDMAPAKAVTKKKPAKPKTKANKPKQAIPDEDSLENIDVSAL